MKDHLRAAMDSLKEGFDAYKEPTGEKLIELALMSIAESLDRIATVLEKTTTPDPQSDARAFRTRGV